MESTEIIMEELTKAQQGVEMTLSDLREANRQAGAVVGIEVLRLIGQAAELAKNISILQNALEADGDNAV